MLTADIVGTLAPQAIAEMFVSDLVAAQARKDGERVALVAEAGEISFGELERDASQLANHLRSLGAGPEMVVGICLERSPQFVVAALAIMKCGAAYLPMDPAHPTQRLRFIAKDSGAHLLITTKDFANRYADLDVRVVDLDSERNAISAQSTQAPELELEADHLAYVIYTSGSTGEPKGVEITHGNLSNLIAWHIRAFDLNASTRATFQAGVGFDAAVWEIWPHLAIGAALHLPNESTRLSATELRDWLVTQQVTISFVPTAIAEQLIALSWPNKTALRFLLTGADTLHRYPPADLPFALVNNYGPTECTVVATSGVVSPNGNREMLPSIGFPIDNVHIHICDERLREVPTGTIGEILIGGAGVARGYRNRPELTAERFITDPFCGASFQLARTNKGQVENLPHSGRWYRSGDLGRRLSNGEIAFLGRSDDQIKIRGYRIELGEINSVLNQQPSVQASVVIMREDVPGEKRLVAYVVPAVGSPRDEAALREAIRQHLPDYMEPSALVWMEALPLTQNGKIDRASLPAPKIDESKNFIAPRTPVEETLAGIIREFLKVPRVSVDDDFFHLGAHSLLGAQIIARVRSVFGAELKLLDVFDAPTVAQLSVKIEEALTRQLSEMSEAEVKAALAALNEDAKKL